MATRVTITKALEAKLRKKWDPLNPEDAFDACGEIVKLLDRERERAASLKTEGKNGLGYKELVALFRRFLGSDLLTPPKPNEAYIVRIVNKGREQGISAENVEQAVRGLCHFHRPPYRLWELVYNYDRHFAEGNGEVERGTGEMVVHTGREHVEPE